MASDMDAARRRAAEAKALTGDRSAQYVAGMDARTDRRLKKRMEEAKLRQQAALEAQRIQAQKDRDKRLAQYDSQASAQRAAAAADAQAMDYGYRSKLNQQTQRGQLKRDELENRFKAAQSRLATQDQASRDRRLFEFGQAENQQQFDNQMQRDAVQNQYQSQRDLAGWGYDTLRSEQQHAQGIEASGIEHDQQLQRAKLANEFDVQGDMRQQANVLERARLEQQFTQQNMYQRQAEEISAKWQDQVAAARNAGLDFSEAQKKEMQQLDEAFRKNVLNGPYDEGIKQRAMVEHQKKLAAIIPTERVQTPKDMLNQAIQFDERTKSWYMMGRDSKGFPTFEPLGFDNGMDSMQKQQQREQQQMEKKQLALQKAEIDRLERFDKVVNELQMAESADGTPLYPPDQVMKEAVKRFRPYEQHYQQQYGLAPLPAYQEEIDKKKADEEAAMEVRRRRMNEVTQRKSLRVNPWNEMLSKMKRKPLTNDQITGVAPVPGEPRYNESVMGPASGQSQQTAQPLPKTITSDTIDAQIQKANESKDTEVSAALQAIKKITERHKGAPPQGSQDMEDLIEATMFLRDKGVPLQGEKYKAPPIEQPGTSEYWFFN